MSNHTHSGPFLDLSETVANPAFLAAWGYLRCTTCSFSGWTEKLDTDPTEP